jgi:hypothetical protein
MFKSYSDLTNEGDFVADCTNCEAKLGLFNKQISCRFCGSGFCGKCQAYAIMVMTGKTDAWMGKTLDDYYVCSLKCWYSAYKEFINSTRKGMPIIILNSGNVGLTITEDTKDHPKGIYFSYMKTDPRKAGGEGSGYIPEVKPMYERVKKDLEKRKRKITEDFDGI